MFSIPECKSLYIVSFGRDVLIHQLNIGVESKSDFMSSIFAYVCMINSLQSAGFTKRLYIK